MSSIDKHYFLIQNSLIMKVFKFKSLLFGLMTVLTVAILITSCGKENLNDTEKNESEILKKKIRYVNTKVRMPSSNPILTFQLRLLIRILSNYM